MSEANLPPNLLPKLLAQGDALLRPQRLLALSTQTLPNARNSYPTPQTLPRALTGFLISMPR